MAIHQLTAHYQALAVLSTGIYFGGLTCFKMAADGMPVLGGGRPVQLARALLGSRTWLTGAAVLGVGATVQATALTRLSLVQAQPMFLGGLAVLLVLAVPILRERLTPREWGCVLLLGAATALFAHAAPSAGASDALLTSRPAGPLVVAVALPSLLVPCLGFLASDLSPKGVHARPLTGVALAVNVGVLTGTAEMMLTGAAGSGDSLPALAATPYPYLFTVTALLALGQLQIALQRSRLAIVGLVATAIAKTYLLTVGTLLYGAPWPADGGQSALALALSVLAVAAVPHHERDAVPIGLRIGSTGLSRHSIGVSTGPGMVRNVSGRQRRHARRPWSWRSGSGAGRRAARAAVVSVSIRRHARS